MLKKLVAERLKLLSEINLFWRFKAFAVSKFYFSRAFYNFNFFVQNQHHFSRSFIFFSENNSLSKLLKFSKLFSFSLDIFTFRAFFNKLSIQFHCYKFHH
jgi:hypothetical protein